MVSRRARCLVGVLALGLAAAGCTSGGSDSSATTSDAGGSSAVRLNVMSFNIEYGGQGVDFDSVAKAIVAADADVVAIQEGYGKVPEIAADLGWDFYDTRTQVVSKYPLLSNPADGSKALLVEVAPGTVVAMINLHLPSSKSGPKLIDKGATAEQVLQNENAIRLPALQPALDEASTLMGQGIPVFVLGDFNAPSHRDWTKETVGLRPHVLFPLRWPTSEAAEAAGLVDSYRALYPDPVSDQGLTWPASRPHVPGYNPGPNGSEPDRIDLVFGGGAVEPVAADIVGEEGSDSTDIVVSPWPSDHRAVVVQFDVEPAPPPTLVSIDQRLIERGQAPSVRYYADGADAASLAVVPVGGLRGTPAIAIEQPLDDPTQGAWQLPTAELEPDSYDVVLRDSSGAALARTTFWLVEPGTTPELSTDRPVYRSGEAITVSWQNAPGNKWDWLGIYEKGADPNVDSYSTWAYTGATISGSETLDREDSGGPWPLPPGEYSVYLLIDDSYEKVAGTDFDVRR